MVPPGIDVQFRRNAVFVQLPVEEITVPDRDHLVVIRMKKDALGCFFVYVEVVGEELGQLFIFVCSQQVGA